ncbi:Uncharacterised protein [Yersinia pekkanenii]|uniref:Uncharacterized protein n=1 Tax=Yersinia pekkanenii TaxID=1288385 RepID=A0A0T9QR21_9GAMM|nr:Uncharacterised protein [Yersinia pekkanenii]CRY66332.1 Uncharacterised protein [Yersinia pekkanenii]
MGRFCIEAGHLLREGGGPIQFCFFNSTQDV